MHFVNPLFLFGLIAVAIPIIVHLFNFRRFKKVFFTNVRFIEELQLKTQKQSKLKHLLVLLFRILAIAAIVIAFAQPYIPLADNKINQDARNAVSVYIDNSFSMEAAASKGSLLEEALRKAKEVTDAFKPSDVFQLLTNDFEGSQQRWVSRDEFIDMLGEVKISSSSRKLSEVASRLKDMMTTSGTENRSQFLISDFQKTISDFNNLKPDTIANTFMIPLAGKKSNNVYIDSCWFDSPLTQLSQLLTLQTRVQNKSEVDYEKVPVKLIINGKQRAVASFDCKAGESVIIPLSFTADSAGLQQAYVELTDFPVTFDDRFYISFRVGGQLPVLCISDKTESVYINALFSKDSAIRYQSVTTRNIDYNNLNANSLIILNSIPVLSSGLIQELHKFLKQGGSIMIFLAEKPDELSWNQFLSAANAGIFGSVDTIKSKINPIDTELDLFRDVFERVPENMDMPRTFDHFRWKFSAQSGMEVLLQHENGDPFLMRNKSLKGKLYIFPFPLLPAYTNFMKHSLFVPVLFKIAMLSQVQPRLSYTIGEDEAIVVSDPGLPGENIFRIRPEAEKTGFIPEVKPVNGQLHVFPHDQIKTAGNFFLSDGNSDISGLSYNYNRQESDLAFNSAEELRNQAEKAGLKNFVTLEAREKPVSLEITSFNKGLRYWKLFVILALLFFATEIAILRLWK